MIKPHAKISLAVGIVLFSAALSSAGSILDSERAIGRLQLGQPENEFKKVTRIKPGPCLGDCTKDETFADVECATKKDVCEAVSEVTGVDVFFWEKRIYFMNAGVKEIPLEEVKKRFSKKFGAPSKVFNQGTPGLKYMQWRTKSTEIAAMFSTDNNMVSTISFKDLTRNTSGAGF